MPRASRTETNFVELMLACASWQEAQRIVDHLLERKLIVRAQFLPTKARTGGGNQPGDTPEVTLLMESAVHLFETIEREIAAVMHYKASALQKLPLEQLSDAVMQRLQNKLGLTDEGRMAGS